MIEAKIYGNDRVSVEWRANLCSNCGICYMEMPHVFNLSRSPWVDVNADTPENIKAQCDRCPDGAIVGIIHENK